MLIIHWVIQKLYLHLFLSQPCSDVHSPSQRMLEGELRVPTLSWGDSTLPRAAIELGLGSNKRVGSRSGVLVLTVVLNSPVPVG